MVSASRHRNAKRRCANLVALQTGARKQCIGLPYEQPLEKNLANTLASENKARRSNFELIAETFLKHDRRVALRINKAVKLAVARPRYVLERDAGSGRRRTALRAKSPLRRQGTRKHSTI